jgi:hypothetical protein
MTRSVPLISRPGSRAGRWAIVSAPAGAFGVMTPAARAASKPARAHLIVRGPKVGGTHRLGTGPGGRRP